jgi:MFS family permease
MSPTFTALKNRNYRLYATGGVVSNIGTWMQRVAQDWLVLQLSGHNGVALGITTGLQFLPMLVLAPFAGTIADRYPKRNVLMVTQTWMATMGAILGVLGNARVWNVSQVNRKA